MTHEQKNTCIMCRTKLFGKGSKEDIERLRNWTKKGKAWAMEALAARYIDGVGVKQSDKKAIELYETAAKKGDAGAQYNLGQYYRRGDLGLTQSIERAIEYWRSAAEQGYVDAQFNLGQLYANGKGIEQSFTKAREWLTKAASQGHENAIKMLKQYHELEGRTTVVCSNCNAPATTNRTLIQCGCRAVSYCNSECQKKHWGAHQVQHGQIETYFKLQKVKKIK